MVEVGRLVGSSSVVEAGVGRRGGGRPVGPGCLQGADGVPPRDVVDQVAAAPVAVEEVAAHHSQRGSPGRRGILIFNSISENRGHLTISVTQAWIRVIMQLNL